MKLHTAIQWVRNLPPGKEINIDTRLIKCNPGNGFTVADRILENIVGSSYEYFYVYNYRLRTTMFGRRTKPTEEDFCTYVSPDRRDYYEQLPNGLYKLKG